MIHALYECHNPFDTNYIQIIYKVTKIQISTHPVYTLLLGVTTLGWLSRKERQNSSNGFVLARH